jgi:hypothetical protein
MTDADRIAELESKLAAAQADLESRAWEISPAMAQAKIDELTAKLATYERASAELPEKDYRCEQCGEWFDEPLPNGHAVAKWDECRQEQYPDPCGPVTNVIRAVAVALKAENDACRANVMRLKRETDEMSKRAVTAEADLASCVEEKQGWEMLARSMRGKLVGGPNVPPAAAAHESKLPLGAEQIESMRIDYLTDRRFISNEEAASLCAQALRAIEFERALMAIVDAGSIGQARRIAMQALGEEEK